MSVVRNYEGNTYTNIDIGSIVEVKVHPSIGIARVGNSPDEYFIGPEIPGHVSTPKGGYKDIGDPENNVPPRIKRQAARFRIYAYDEHQNVLGEVTTDIADIEWTVHLANKKAEWDEFNGPEGEDQVLTGKRVERERWRNRYIEERKKLIIDPGPRTLTKPLEKKEFDNGKFLDVEVPLGHIMTDEKGRLLVLGGFGKSASAVASNEITNYANNDFWHDDVSDGPVTAKVKLKDSPDDVISATPAWVIVTPPDFAPPVAQIVTLYDVALDTMITAGKLPPIEKPSFNEHILPILTRAINQQWVQEEALKAHGPRPVLGYDISAMMGKLSSPDPENSEVRKKVFKALRNPYEKNKDEANSRFMPFLSGDSGSGTAGDPETWFTITRTQYNMMKAWEEGNFIPDYNNGENQSGHEKVKQIPPADLDRASLEATAGGPFFPGIEGGWIFRNPRIYSEPFRLHHSILGPGDVTKRMACPWQADFYECRRHWWPAQRPDEVLSFFAYEKIIDIDKKIKNLTKKENSGNAELQAHIDSEIKDLNSQRETLWAKRYAWTRGLPATSPEGDNYMVEYWSLLGFVSDRDEQGNLFRLPDNPAAEKPKLIQQMIETARNKYEHLDMAEYFHLLVNIEDYQDFVPTAKKLATGFLNGADFEADESYAAFQYSPEALDERMKEIYNNFLMQMDEKYWLDTGIITYSDIVIDRTDNGEEIKGFKQFWIGGPFSDRVVKERARQLAPFNLVDGAWLQNIVSTGPCDDVQARLFQIWSDEAGNGKIELNHPNVYEDLLKSLNIYMPPIRSREFIERDFLPGAFDAAVFQLSVGLFPQEFFPELLGMTLFLEWEATPTLTPIVRMLHDRYLNPQFYRMHVAIDNITAGHGALAKEAVKLYLNKKLEEGGETAVQEHWQRIWRGYVTWATMSGLGKELLDRFLTIDRKQIDIASYILEVDPFYGDTDKNITSEQSASQFVSKLKDRSTPPANHLYKFLEDAIKDQNKQQEKRVRNLQELLRLIDEFDGNKVSISLRDSLVNNLNHLFVEKSLWNKEAFDTVELDHYTKLLIEQEPGGAWLVELNRRLLQAAFPEINKVEPQLFPDYVNYYAQRMISLVRTKAPVAKIMHRNKKLDDQNLASLFDTPRDLLIYLAKSHWVDKEHPSSSEFFDLLDFQGPMYKIFNTEEREIIQDWLEVASEWLEGLEELGAIEPEPSIPLLPGELKTHEARTKPSRLVDPIKVIIPPRRLRSIEQAHISHTLIQASKPLTINLMRSVKTNTLEGSKKPKSGLFKEPSFPERRSNIGVGSVH